MSVDSQSATGLRLPSLPSPGRLAAVAAGTLLAAACVAIVVVVGGKVGLIFGVVLVTLIALAIAWRLHTDFLDGPGIYALSTLLFFGVTSLAWLGTPPTPGPDLAVDDIDEGLLLVAAALALFGLAATIAYRPRPMAMLPLLQDVTRWWALVVCWGIGISVLTVGVISKAYGYVLNLSQSSPPLASTQAFTSIGTFANIAVLCTAFMTFGSPRRPYRWLLAAMVVVQGVFGFVAGFKAAALDPFVFVLLAYVVTRRRFPWVPIAAAAAVVVLLLIPANEAYRAGIRENADDPTGASHFNLSDYRPDKLVSAGATTGVDYFFTRFREIDSIALVRSQTPSIYPYGSGSHYIDFPLLLLVPRALWPDKPRLDDGDQFSITYWQFRKADHTSTGVTAIGDLYRNFGLAGTLVGMALLGVVVALGTRLYQRFFSYRAVVIWLFVLYKGVYVVELGLPDLFSTLLKALPFVAIAAWLLLPGRTAPAGYRRIGRRVAALRGQ